MKLLCALAVSAVVIAASIAASAARSTDVTGVYQSNWDEVRLVQRGSHVTGGYVCCGGGTIDGEVDGGVVRYRWREPRGAGDGVGEWKINGNRLEGSWGRKTIDDGGTWNLWRVQTGEIAQ